MEGQRVCRSAATGLHLSRGTGLALLFAVALLWLSASASAGIVYVTASVENVAPNTYDENVSPSSWTGSGSVTLGFKCSDPNSLQDFNKAHAAITGSNTADLNSISYTTGNGFVFIALDISGYLSNTGTYYVMPFCTDKGGKATAGSQIIASYVSPTEITVSSPVQDANINANPLIEFDVNKNAAFDVNRASIQVDLNGTASSDFNADNNCTGFSGEFHCSYTETGLAENADNNVSFNASDKGGNKAEQVERIAHFDSTAPTISSISASKTGSNVAVSWAGSDSFTGIESFYVREDSGAWIEKGKGLTHAFSGSASADHTYYVKARDFADNNSLISQKAYSAPEEEEEEPPAAGPGGGGVPPAEKGFFEADLTRIDDPLEAGEYLDFTYTVWNRTRYSDNIYVEYWVESNGARVGGGSETLFLREGKVEEVDGRLLIQEGVIGNCVFFIRVSDIPQKPIEISREITVMSGAPTVIELENFYLKAGDESKPLEFGFEIASNRDETLPVLVEETLYRNEKVVWGKSQTVAVSVFDRFSEEIYGLEPGSYMVEVVASYGEERATASETFEIKPEARLAPLPEALEEAKPFLSFLLWMAPIIAALLAFVEALLYLFSRRIKAVEGRAYFRDRRVYLVYLTAAAAAAAMLFLIFIWLHAGAAA